MIRFLWAVTILFGAVILTAFGLTLLMDEPVQTAGDSPGAELIPGPPGPTGPQGPRGYGGERGERGNRGDRGPRERRGARGHPAFRDPSGIQGRQGLRGIRGGRGARAQTPPCRGRQGHPANGDRRERLGRRDRLAPQGSVGQQGEGRGAPGPTCPAGYAPQQTEVRTRANNFVQAILCVR